MDITTLGIAVDSTPVEKANANLDKLAAAGAKAEQSSSRLGATASKAYQGIQAEIARVLTQMERQAAAQEKTNALLEQMAVASKAASSGVAQVSTAQAATTATGSAFNTHLSTTTQNMNAAAQSAKQAAAQIALTGTTSTLSTQQMQGLVHAVRSFVDQVVAGASPIKAAALEIGKLAGTFGSVSGAVAAIGSVITPMTVAVGLGAGVVTGLAVAWNLGAGEAREFGRQITLSGNAAGTSVSQLQTMAQNIGGLTGTVGKAAQVLALMVSTGKIPSENLQQYSELAVRLERVGVDAKDTVADFAALGKDPVAAALKLNDSMNFLEVSTFRQIKALQDLGKEQDAADLAQKAYADAQAQRLPQLEAQLGTLESSWVKVKDAILGVVDAAKAIGRPDGLDQQIAKVQASLRVAQGQDPNRPFQLPFGSSVSDLQEQEKRLLRMKEIEQSNAASDKMRADQTHAAAEYEKVIEGSLSNQQKIAKEAERVRNLSQPLLGTTKADGTTFGQADIDKAVAAVSYDQAKLGIEAQIERLKTQAQIVDIRTKAAQIELQAQRAMGMLSESQAIDKSAALEISDLQQHKSLLQDEIALKSKERDSEAAVAGLRGQISVVDAQITARKKQADTEQLVRLAALEKQTYAVATAEREQQHQELATAAAQQDAQFAQHDKQAKEYVQSVEDANRELDFQVSILGKSADEQARLNEQHKIDITLAQQKRRIDQDVKELSITAQDGANQTKLFEDAAAKAQLTVDTKLYIDKWRETNREVSDGLYDGLTGKGQDAADKIKDIFGNLVLRPLLQPIANSITGFLLGGPGAAAAGAASGGLGGLGSLAGSAGSLASLGSLATAFTAGSSSVGVMAGSIAGGGGLLGGAASALGGIGPVGWAALAGLAAVSLLGGKGHGPKTSNGAGIGVQTTGDVASVSNTIKAIQSQYAGIISGLGGTPGQLDLGIFSAQDPNGTALTQLQVNAALNGQSVYSRDARLGHDNIENVGRSDADLQAAMTEETERVVLSALQASNLTGAVGDYLKQLGDINTLSGGAVDASLTKAQAIATQQAQLQAQIFDLTATDSEKLTKQRQAELDAVDDVNKAMVKRLQALQDEKTASDALADALGKAQSGVADFQDFMKGITSNVHGYIDKLNASPAGLLSPEQQLENAKAQFQQQLSRAGSGDRTALSNITGYADQLISAQEGYSASGGDTAKVIADIKTQLAALPNLKSDAEMLADTITDTSKAETDKIWDGLWGSAGLLAGKFATLDTNVDGLLDFNELKTALGPLASDDTVRALIAKADTNNDGMLSKEEAVRAGIFESTAAQTTVLAGVLSPTPRASPQLVQAAMAVLDSGSTGIPGSSPGNPLNPGYFADGGDHPGGFRVVGERGPELEFTGPSHIVSNADTARMLSKADPQLLAEIKALRSEMQGLVRVSAAHARNDRDQGDAIVQATTTLAQGSRLQQTKPVRV